MSAKDSFSALKELAIHVVVGFIAFILVALPAVGLDFLVKFLIKIGVSELLILALTGLEYTVFGLDVLLALFFFTRTIYRMLKKT